MRKVFTLIPPLIFIATLLHLGGCNSSPDEPEPVVLTGEKILMFVSKENSYYSEYVVMLKALQAAGYTVEVRSSGAGTASTYMEPSGTTIDATANTLDGSSYAAFQTQFKNMFGQDWSEALNSTPATVDLDGKIQEVESMDNYLGLVIIGGTGSLNYRVDGSYDAQGSISSADVELAAQKLNTLGIDALVNGKPVLAQCHAASLAVFWNITGTSTSLLSGKLAAGFPEAATATTYSSKNVSLRPEDKVVISSPADMLDDAGKGDYRLITSRDWYPQTVAHAAKAFINVLSTYPQQNSTAIKVLLMHGGVVDESNCSAGNRQNDVPCNYGGDINLPSDYSHIKNLLQAAKEDKFQFLVTDVNITSSPLPYTANNQSSIESYLNGFDVVIFFKHWSTGVNTSLQNALVSFVDNGGGLLALHHGLYNDIDDADPSLNKNIIAQTLFKCESAEAGWGASRTNYKMISTNYGHFVSTFNVDIANNSVSEIPGWQTHPGASSINLSLSVYQSIELFDEVYTNKEFISNPVFGEDVNEITPLFSNNLTGAQAHTEGFVRTFNGNGDQKIGKVAFFQAGETKQNFTTGSPYGQVVRNAVYWLGNKP